MKPCSKPRSRERATRRRTGKPGTHHAAGCHPRCFAQIKLHSQSPGRARISRAPFPRTPTPAYGPPPTSPCAPAHSRPALTVNMCPDSVPIRRRAGCSRGRGRQAAGRAAPLRPQGIPERRWTMRSRIACAVKGRRRVIIRGFCIAAAPCRRRSGRRHASAAASSQSPAYARLAAYRTTAARACGARRAAETTVSADLGARPRPRPPVRRHGARQPVGEAAAALRKSEPCGDSPPAEAPLRCNDRAILCNGSAFIRSGQKSYSNFHTTSRHLF